MRAPAKRRVIERAHPPLYVIRPGGYDARNSITDELVDLVTSVRVETAIGVGYGAVMEERKRAFAPDDCGCEDHPHDPLWRRRWQLWLGERFETLTGCACDAEDRLRQMGGAAGP